MIESTVLLDHLQQLSRRGFLHFHQPEQDAEYSFASTLVYEAARGSLVKQDRRKLHLATAETLEDIYSERLDELAPLLADHFHHAGEDRQAMLYYTMAGHLALQRFANAEAARFFSSNEGYEPIHAVNRRETCLPAIESAIEADQWKVIAWFPQVKVQVLTSEDLNSLDPDGLAFWNVNTPEEFAEAERIASAQ